jgi:hypothetical protein
MMSTYLTRSQLGQLAGMTTSDVRHRDDAGDIAPAFRSARRHAIGRPDEDERSRFRRRSAFALIVGRLFTGAGLGRVSVRKIVRWLDHKCLDLEAQFRTGNTHLFGCHKHVFVSRADSTFLGGPGAVLLALDVADLWRQFVAALDGQLREREGARASAPATTPRPELLRAIELQAGVQRVAAGG